ncbi:GTP-binding protein [Lysinibacillus sphaericus C3-41]|nr:GTP-binding protein [Lysinibacillus sphaericus C3-41]
MDMPDAEENLTAFRQKVGEDVQIFPISAVSRQGLKELLFAIADLLEVTPEFPLYDEVEEQSDATVMYKHEAKGEDFEITRDDDGTFIISGYAIERLFKMTDFSREDGIRRFARQLRAMGVDEALRERGAQDGDTVRLQEFEFEFVD